MSAVMGLWQFSGGAGLDARWIATSPNHEVYANLRQRNQLATLLVMGAVILAWYISHSEQSKRYLAWCAMSLLMTCLAATASRTGAVQLAVLILVMMAARSAGHRALLRVSIGVLLLYLVALIVMPWLSEALGHTNSGLLSRLEDPNAFSRIALWNNVIELIAQSPWTGHGWRSLAYAHYSTEFSGQRFMEMLDNAHNLPLHLAVELGMPVAVLFCVLVGWLVYKGRPWAETRPERLMAWGILMVIGIHSMVEYPLWYGPFFLTALLCAMILLQGWSRDWMQQSSLAGTKSAQYATQLIAIALLAFTAFAAFDYHRVSQIYLQPDERSSWYANDALGAAQKSVLFQSHAKFAELVITPLSRASAPRVLQLSSELVHWSPEPRVIEKLIESAVIMGLDDLAAFHLKRYRVAYPQAYAAWRAQSATNVL
ncbi:MAG: PglL family O-oligosaccharyltransferase [Brachymonas sp.]